METRRPCIANRALLIDPDFASWTLSRSEVGAGIIFIVLE